MTTTQEHKYTARETLTHWWIACVAAFLLLCKHLKMYTVADIRYDAFWGTGDAIAFSLDIVLLGTLLFGIFEGLRRTPVNWMRRLGDALFFMMIAFCLIGYPRTGWRDAAMPWLPGLCTIATCLVVFVALLIAIRKNSQVPYYTRKACLIFSPVVPIVLIQLFQYPVFSIVSEQMPAAANQTTGRTANEAGTHSTVANRSVERPDIYVIILDQWSYTRTFVDGRISDDLPNMGGFAENATVFHDAHSPYPETMRSLPGILFQTEDEYQVRNGTLGFEVKGDNLQDVHERDSLFAAGKRLDYRTFMIGVTHPYRRMFEDELDYCFTSSPVFGNPNDRMLGKSMVRHLLHGLADATTAVPKPAAIAWRLNRFWQRACRPTSLTLAPRNLAQIHERALAVIRDQTGPTLSILHYPVPHDPYIFDRNGVNEEACRNMPLIRVPKGDGTFTLPNSEFTVTRYLGNLRYADTLLGELVAGLRSAGKYDNSIIVLTSDHNWNLDPDFNGEMTRLHTTHVPLMIKTPRQSTSHERHSIFHLSRIGELILANQLIAHRSH